jgi:hypothetical protein
MQGKGKELKEAKKSKDAAAETVKKAVEMITVEGARIKDVARQLGVSQKELRTGIASYNGDFERCSVEVVDSMSDSLGIMARRALPKIFEVMTEKLGNPLTSLGEITGAARLFYDIYRKETDDGNADGNDPVSRLFELRTKS